MAQAPFKELVDAALVERYAAGLAAVPGFDGDAFRAAVLPALPALELKARVRCVADALADQLSGDFPTDAAALCALAGPPADLAVKNSFDFGLWPATMFVQRQGLDHPDAALDALHHLTQRFSGEFAIRPFLRRHPERTWARLHAWTADPSPHVRRLCSEGTRPRLPWGGRLQGLVADPRPGLGLLERLRADPHPYVRRSVANHLGDIAKDHLELAVGTLLRWREEVPGPDTEWILRHALRHPVKQGAPAALRAVGLDPGLPVKITDLVVSEEVVLGGRLEVAATLVSERDGDAEIDLVVHFVKARGERRPKTFKGVRRTLRAGVPVAFEKSLPLRDVSTRTHHPGLHRVEVQVNGVVRGGADFLLRVE